MREAQLFGEQVERSIGALGLLSRQGQVLARRAQGLHMARAGGEQAFGLRVPAGEFEQPGAQRCDAFAGAGRECDAVAPAALSGDERIKAVGRRAAICASPAS